MGKELRQLAATGAVSAQLLADTQNITLIKSRNPGSSSPGMPGRAMAVSCLLVAVMILI